MSTSLRPVINLNLERIKSKGLFFSWKWREGLESQFNNSVVKTIISIFYVDKILIKTIKLRDPKSTNFLIHDFHYRDLKVCLNISVTNITNSTIGPGPLSHFEQCIKYKKDQWSMSVPLGTSLAAFLVLLLIVSVIFLTKRFEKSRKIMLLKSTSEKVTRSSFIYLYQPTDLSAPCQNDNFLLNNNENKDNEGNTKDADCPSSKLDCESINGIESLDSVNKEDYSDPNDSKNYNIIKCSCGLIHLIGTETECDNLLQYTEFENQKDKPFLLTHEETIPSDSEKL